MSAAAFTVHAGARAAAHVRREGLAPRHIRCVPAAAGGPKGLALIPLDRRLFGASGWLRGRDAAPLDLIGASIGAWRMMSAAQHDADAALMRLADGYVGQTYSRRPSPLEVSAECRKLAQATLGAAALLPPTREGVRVSIITARATGALADDESRRAFARAALDNAFGRERLATHLQRVVFSLGEAPFAPFDRFGWHAVTLTAHNAEDALLASGSIPLVCAPVRDIAGAPAGAYWDGGLIDYHLLLPYAQLDGLVLYPHFVPYVTPGWLDKFLPWRRAQAHPWLDNLLLVAPSPALLARLPNGKLPDRNDFYRYGQDHVARQRDWRRAIAECERFADEVMAWLERPDPTRLAPL